MKQKCLQHHNIRAVTWKLTMRRMAGAGPRTNARAGPGRMSVPTISLRTKKGGFRRPF